MNQPEANEIEVTVIGPSYGESVVVHLGDNRWIIVDSTTPPDKQEPSAISHLRSLGLDPAECVELVIVTHWHDDHIRGITDTVKICRRAAICVSSAFSRDEFLSFLAAHTDPAASTFGSGVDEIMSVFTEMRSRELCHLASADKRLINIPSGEMSHDQAVEAWALSPSSFQINESLGKLGGLIPGLGQTKRRAVPTGKNDHSVALWISIGQECILLGGDLEETSDPRGGWTAVVASRNRPGGRASYFKVPHHGSRTGHNDSVWTEMLGADPQAVLTPWNRSTKLPTNDDMIRLGALTCNLHLTAPPSTLSRVKHDHEVERLLRDFGIRTFREPPEVGVVTARKVLGERDWSISRRQL